MFKRLGEIGETVSLKVDGKDVRARAGDTVAGAMLAAGVDHFRTTPVTESP
ncbi:MAG: 2Fe-2S iron-sulfur cluster-binding protein, partial [Reyranellales bacterium]